MTNDQWPREGVFEELQKFARDAVERDFPASAISLTAIRTSKPGLARTIFVEAVIRPAQEILRKCGAAPPSELEELVTKFRQLPIVELFQEVELLAASRLVWRLWEQHGSEYVRLTGIELKDQYGRLLGGTQLLDWIARDVASIIAQLANLRERRVQLLLAATVAGEDAFREAMGEHRECVRNTMLETIWSWLALNGYRQEKPRRALTDRIAKGRDDQIAKVAVNLVGAAFVKRKAIATMVDEIFTGEEHIEF